MFILIMIMSLMLLFGVIRIGLTLAWGVTKLVFGIVLFFICPLVFAIAVLFGLLLPLMIPIAIIGLLCGRGFAHG